MLLWVIALYLILNYGFMQLRIPPTGGGGIPLGELLLLFSLATIRYGNLLPKLNSIIFLFPFIVWWLLGISRALVGMTEHGMWALRDATHVIESLFLLVGFAFAARSEVIEYFYQWLPKILIITCIYAIGYPAIGLLQDLSPKIIAGAGYEIPLFFMYTNTSMILLWAATYLVIFKNAPNIGVRFRVFIAATIVAYVIFLFQARTIYLQLIAIALLFLLYRKELIGKGVVIIVVILSFLFIMPFIGLQVVGRIGQTVSLEFIVNHFLAIAGIESEGLEGSVAGVNQRLGWWTNLYYRWTEDIGSILFGLGYGFPLIDFGLAGGIKVREPHNSYISILARVGVVGSVVWLWMHIILIKVWHRSYKRCEKMGLREGQNRLLILMVFFVLSWVFAIGEDAFEKPFVAIPYYFFWGVVLRFIYNQKRVV
jgi:hypothetical protein